MSDPAVVGMAEKIVPILKSHAAEVDERARFPEAGMAALRESGLLGLLVPKEDGGLGGDIADLVEVAQLLSSGCLSTALIWAMHCQQVDAVVHFASDSLKEYLLPRIACGEAYLASVTTEPTKGGHILSSTSPLRRSMDRIQLEREAPVVTGGNYADGFLITMRDAAEAPEDEVTLVYADRDQLKITARGEWDTLGMRGTESVGMHLTGSIPETQVVGGVGGFRHIVVESMAPLAHLGWSACWLGSARAALGDLVALIRSTDRPRGIDVRSDLTLERLARIRMDLELTGAYLHRVRDEVLNLRSTGRSLDAPTVHIHVNTLKLAAAELTFRSVDRMIQLAGLRVGYDRCSVIPLERHFRDLRSAALNYADDRLLVANGALTLMDRAVRIV